MSLKKVGVTLRNFISFTVANVGVLIAFVFGIVISSFQIYSDYTKQGDLLAQTVEQILQVTESSATPAVYKYDEALANREINGLFVYKPIIEVIITDDFGEEITATERGIFLKKKSILLCASSGRLRSIARNLALFARRLRAFFCKTINLHGSNFP